MQHPQKDATQANPNNVRASAGMPEGGGTYRFTHTCLYLSFKNLKNAAAGDRAPASYYTGYTMRPVKCPKLEQHEQITPYITIHQKIAFVKRSAYCTANQHNKAKQKRTKRQAEKERTVTAPTVPLPAGCQRCAAVLSDFYCLTHDICFICFALIGKISSPAQNKICFFKIGAACIGDVNNFFLTSFNHVRHILPRVYLPGFSQEVFDWYEKNIQKINYFSFFMNVLHYC